VTPLTPADSWRIGRRSNRDYTKRRVLGLAPWKPKAPTQPLVQAIDRVLDEYRDFWPLTARQVYYRLIGLGGIRLDAEEPSPRDAGTGAHAIRRRVAAVRARSQRRWAS
jgi:hypothetical protein